MYIFTAVFLDALFGDPKKLLHPVSGVGAVVRFWEKRLYQEDDKKRAGVILCWAVLATTAAVIGLILLLTSFVRPLYFVAVLYLLYAALAWRSLKDETLPVAVSLFKGDLPHARKELSRVVGRNTESLDEAGVVRAAIETIGENFIDGVFSVLFFAALGCAIGALFGCASGGAAGAVIMAWLFKAVSTMDSMVGYDNEQYRDFGCASAKLDDVLNFIPARLGGAILLFAGACLGYPFLKGWKVFLRDRKKHKSPNSAHGESAFAGLLGIKLGGGAEYGGVFEARPEIGDDPKTSEAEAPEAKEPKAKTPETKASEAREPEPTDILRAHSILDASVALCALILLSMFGICS